MQLPFSAARAIRTRPAMEHLAAATLIVGAWLVILVAQGTGHASLLHHHWLIEDGPPLWLGIPLFLVAWLVMTAAMMLPASLPAIRAFGQRTWPRPGFAIATFLGVFAVAWTGFGFLAFLGDVVVHHLVHETPWLEARPWLVEGGVIALAGAYQFAPSKRAGLAACRHPARLMAESSSRGPVAFRLGLEHGLACLASSWALMLLMFAAGFANLAWMAILTGVMVYETIGRHGQRAASAVGGMLVLLAVAVTATGALSVV
jgi:predicted metal-binding membrane protein